jgi:hypothetical protein
MGYGYFTDKDGKSISFGFNSVGDWFDSVLESFPAPWLIGDDTHYGTEIFDARGHKVLSVWMAWGNPSPRQRGDMTDAEWSEYCCDSHWESETQWHIANAIVTTRNYLDAHKRNGWYGDNDDQRELLRSLVMTHGRWEEDVDAEISCGGPDKRMTATEHDSIAEHPHYNVKEYRKRRTKEQQEMRAKAELIKPTLAINPEAEESSRRSRSMFAAIARMVEERPAQSVTLPNGLRIDSFTMMDRPYLERLAEIASEEYEK